MPTAAQVLRDAESLSAEERILLVDSLLRSLNPPEPEVEKAWAVEAKRRLEEFRSGKVKAVPAEEVFARIRQRLAR